METRNGSLHRSGVYSVAASEGVYSVTVGSLCLYTPELSSCLKELAARCLSLRKTGFVSLFHSDHRVLCGWLWYHHSLCLPLYHWHAQVGVSCLSEVAGRHTRQFHSNHMDKPGPDSSKPQTSRRNAYLNAYAINHLA